MNTIQTTALWMHLSQFAGWFVPLLGFIAPIVIWQMNKSEKYLDAEGKSILNGMLSYILYGVIAGILCLILIGFLLLPLLAILYLVQIIVQAIRASRGDTTRQYLFAIKFLK